MGKGRNYSLQEFVSFYERLAHYQAKAARQERIKALSKMPGIPDGERGGLAAQPWPDAAARRLLARACVLFWCHRVPDRRLWLLNELLRRLAGAEGNELLKRVFLNYCKYTVGQGRSTFDEAEPKMSSTQYVKLCQDLGLVQPNGEAPPCTFPTLPRGPLTHCRQRTGSCLPRLLHQLLAGCKTRRTMTPGRQHSYLESPRAEANEPVAVAATQARSTW